MYWSAAVLIVLAYAVYYGQMVMRHTAVPYFDQTNYMYRIYYIHDVWKKAKSVADYFDILGGAFADRPPLMMIPPALLWGDHAHPQSVALLWLIIRMGVLLLAMVALSRSFKTARFVPAALMAILGSAFFLGVHPHQYQMDQAFAVVGFLVFALVLRDLTRPSAWNAAMVALATVMLVLVKPAAPSFVFPMFAVVAVRGGTWLVTVWRTPGDRFRWVSWATIYAVMIAVLVLLWKSPYGRAVAEHYELGNRGYWARQLTLMDALQSVVLLVPLWLLLLLALYLAVQQRVGVSKWIIACGLATAAWWYVFNNFITYASAERVVAAALAVTVTLPLVILCQDMRLAIAASTVAGVLFVFNLTTAASARTALEALMGPMAKAERPVSEVGLLPLVDRVRTEVTKVHQPPAPVVVVVAATDEFVESSALNLAMRYAGGDVWSFIQFEPLPWGSSDFDLTRLLQSRWFLTKRNRSAVGLAGDAWVSLYAMDALITDPASPLRRHFERRADASIRQPEFAESPMFGPERPNRLIDETVTLWFLATAPALGEQAEALRWVEPRFRNTPGHGALLSQIKRVEAVARQRTGVELIDANTSNGIVAGADPSLRDISFDDRFRLLGITQRRSGEGVELELAWESRQDQTLDGIVFVHLLDAKTNIVSQLDYAQDRFTGSVKKGAMWRDTIRIPRDKLSHIKTIGLGILRLPTQIFPIDRGPRDWDGHRLNVVVR